jgi:hypothetical protein
MAERANKRIIDAPKRPDRLGRHGAQVMRPTLGTAVGTGRDDHACIMENPSRRPLRRLRMQGLCEAIPVITHEGVGWCRLYSVSRITCRSQRRPAAGSGRLRTSQGGKLLLKPSQGR